MSEQNPRSSDLPPAMQMMQFIWPAIGAAQAIYVAAKLGLADLLANGPRSLEELAEATKAHASTLGRLLRALATLGIFAEHQENSFRNTQLSETLRAGRPDSIRPWATFLAAPFCWRPWGGLYEAVLTGRPAFDHVYGEPFFKYLAAHPQDAATFNAAMSAGSSTAVSAILAAYDFSRFERIVDVGGGQGALLHGILKATPGLRGVLYDLPAVVAGAAALRTAEIAARSEIVGGDFFEAVPEGADAYLLKGIIHDWNDEDALKILKNCRRAIRPGGRLLLLETVLGPSTEPARGLMDLMMLVLVGGRERTESDFRALLAKAGFSLSRVIATAAHSIVESQPL